ncbi:MAG: hypothetical protein NC826_05020 [Candidatus Omnitrophica bacterium]|nr:hypothetical protein [Candidatus Omnitrophota bacterium]
MMKVSNSRAQSLAEYAIVVAAVIAALSIMSIWIRGAIQGKVRGLATQISDKPYAPKQTTSYFTTTRTGTVVEEYKEGTSYVYMGQGGGSPEVTTRSGYEIVEPNQEE